MKKLFLTALAAVCFTSTYYANTSSVSSNTSVSYFKNPYFQFISPSELPAEAQNVINQHFGGLSNVTKAKIDRYKYEVETRDGFEIEFNFDGSVKSIESDYKSIPFQILASLPGEVNSYVNSKFAGWKLLEVEVKKSKIEISLEKGRYEAELKFNGSGKLLKVKYDD